MCVDWSYLHEREKAALQKESGWLKRQGVRIIVDLSSGVNLYPTLRLIDNLPEDYAASMAAVNDVLAKMELLGARDLILSLHRNPENNFTGDQTRAAFTATLKALAGEAAERGVTLHLRVGSGKPPRNLWLKGLEWLDRVNAPNLKLALSTASLERQPPAAEAAAGSRTSWDCGSSPHRGEMPPGRSGTRTPRFISRAARRTWPNGWRSPPAPQPSWMPCSQTQDEEYLEAVTLDQALARPAAAAAR